MDIQSILVLLFVCSALSLFVIYSLKIKTSKKQIEVFSVILLVGLCFYAIKQVCYPNGMNGSNGVNGVNGANANESANNKDHEFTYDRILPIKSYNPDDCTNDGTCIIPPSTANLHGFHEKKGENPFKNQDLILTQEEAQKKDAVELSTCERCKRPLTLENNPSTEMFKQTCECNSCSSEDKQNCVNNRLCIYCKTAYLQNHACYSPKTVPAAFFELLLESRLNLDF